MGRCILCHWATREAPILFFGEDLEFYNEIFKRMIKKKKRSLHFGANPKPGTPSSSNFVVWGFFTRRCVTPPLLQNIRLLLSKCHSGSRSSAQSPERDPLPVLPIWEMPPAQPHAASRPPALSTGPSSQKKKATKLKACYLSLPEPKHSAACVTHTPRPRQTLHVSTLISLAFPSPQFLDLIPPHAGHFFHPNTSKPLDSWPVYLQVWLCTNLSVKHLVYHLKVNQSISSYFSLHSYNRFCCAPTRCLAPQQV